MALIAGNYCHDVLFRDGLIIGETLGGAVSFISNALDALSPLNTLYVSKVGSDFMYAPTHQPIVSEDASTTVFHAHFPVMGSGCRCDRVLKRVQVCEPIYATDFPDLSEEFEIGLAVGVGGEITVETLNRMLDLCKVVFVDVQGLIRSFDPTDGAVNLVPLKSTSFFELLDKIHFLKVSSEEAEFLVIEEVRKSCCVIVTEGKDGCKIYWREGEISVDPFHADQVDPTGAGDSFFGGFVLGLMWGFSVPDSALLGNFFGSLTVAQIGVPKFDPIMLQKIKRILESMSEGKKGLHANCASFEFGKSNKYDELKTSLQEIVEFFTCAELDNGHVEELDKCIVSES
ncbi:hypothetical protein LUZ60_006605 [Juncus effusus]|nr:hypothetical protein LUZ60_006605 [Juncus effusus]